MEAMILEKRRLYNNAYREHLEDPDQPKEPTGQDADPDATSEGPDAATPSDITWKQRYGDLRRHSNSLTDRVKALELQLLAAQKKEMKIPSTQQELQTFSQRYPDVVRHIRSLAMAELLSERENISTETQALRQDLEQVKRERGLQRILKAHPDFEELNLSEGFHSWARLQPQQIQDWLFEESDPNLCIKAIDLFKAEKAFSQKSQKRQTGADSSVNTRSPVDINDTGGRKVWKASEIKRLHWREYEKFEDEIEAARKEGRFVDDLTR